MDIIDLIAITQNMKKWMIGRGISSVEYFPKFGFYKLKTGSRSLWVSVNPKYPFIDISQDDSKGENSTIGMHIKGMVMSDIQIQQEDLVIIISLQHPLIPSKKKYLIVELQRMKTNFILSNHDWVINWIHKEINGRGRQLFVGSVYIPPPIGKTIPLSQWNGEKNALVRGISKERRKNQSYDEIMATLETAKAGKGATGTIENYWHIIAPSENFVKIGSWLNYYKQLISAEQAESQKIEEQKRLLSERRKLQTLLKKLQEELETTNQANFFMKLGNALLTYPHHLKPDGTFTFEDWETGEIITLKFTPGQSPRKLAQTYFAKYKKLKSKRERLLMRIRDLEENLKGMEFGAIKSHSSQKAKNHDKHKSLKGVLKLSDGKNIYIVGKNAKASHTVTFKIAKEQDFWFHTRAYEGSHVILKGSPTPKALEKAAKLAAFFSKAPKEGIVEVAYTQKKYVKPIKGVTAGVTYSNEHIVRVKPASPQELGLKRA